MSILDECMDEMKSPKEKLVQPSFLGNSNVIRRNDNDEKSYYHKWNILIGLKTQAGKLRVRLGNDW